MIDLLPEMFNQICSFRAPCLWVTDGHRQYRSDARMSLKKHSILLSLAFHVDSIEHQALLLSPWVLGGVYLLWFLSLSISNTRINMVEWVQYSLKSHTFAFASRWCFQNSVTHKWRIVKIFITIKRISLRKNWVEIMHWQYNLSIYKFT